MNNRRTIHVFSLGPPPSLSAVGLGARFHVWGGVSGRRYITTVFSAASPPDFEGAVAILVRVEADGTRVALWAGRLPASPEQLAEMIAVKGADEVHVHLTAETEADRARASADMASFALVEQRTAA